MTNDVAQLRSGGLVDPAQMADSLINLASQSPQGPNILQGRMLLKLDKGTGAWLYGQESFPLDTAILIDPASFQHGVIAWGDKRDIIGERMSPLGTPCPTADGLPPGDYKYQLSFGAAIPATNTQLIYKTTAQGGIEFVELLGGTIGMHIKADPAAPRIAQITLSNTSYQHRSYGRIYKPVFVVDDWVDNSDEKHATPRVSDEPAAQVDDGPETPAAEPKRRRTRRA